MTPNFQPYSYKPQIVPDLEKSDLAMVEKEGRWKKKEARGGISL
jgi:hypothetical protein